MEFDKFRGYVRKDGTIRAEFTYTKTLYTKKQLKEKLKNLKDGGWAYNETEDALINFPVFNSIIN
jgi:hypothetical protein